MFGEGESNETIFQPTGSSVHGFLTKYNRDWTLAWAKQVVSDDRLYPHDMAILSDDSAVVAGYFRGTATFGAGEPNETSLAAVSYDSFVARYNADGTFAWVTQIGGDDYQRGYAVTVLEDDSVIVTGYVEGAATFGAGEPNETTLNSDGRRMLLARYGADGALVWAKEPVNGAGVLSGFSTGRAVRGSEHGSFLVQGYFSGAVTFGPGEANETTLSTGDVSRQYGFLAKYRWDGTLAWVTWFGGSGQTMSGYDLSVLDDGTALITGSFTGGAAFGAGETQRNLTYQCRRTGCVSRQVRCLDRQGCRWYVPTIGKRTRVSTRTTPQMPASISDNDGLTNLQEHNNSTDPDNPDTDGDGYTDGDEAAAGTNPLDASSYPVEGRELIWARRDGGAAEEYPVSIASFDDGSMVEAGRFEDAATFGQGEPNEDHVGVRWG